MKISSLNRSLFGLLKRSHCPSKNATASLGISFSETTLNYLKYLNAISKELLTEMSFGCRPHEVPGILGEEFVSVTVLDATWIVNINNHGQQCRIILELPSQIPCCSTAIFP